MSKESTAENYYAKSCDLYDCGNIKKAISILNKAISLFPHSVEYLSFRAYMYLEALDLENAIADYTLLIEYETLNSEYLYSRGNAYLEMEKYPEAIADFTAAIAIEPDEGPYYFFRAHAYLELGEVETALIDYKEAIKLQPKNAEYYAAIGHVLIEENQYKEALSYFDKAKERDEKNAEYYFSCGYLHYLLQNPNEAVKAYSTAIHMEKNSVYLVYRGSLYYEQGEVAEAHNDFSVAIEISPTYSEAYFKRGQALFANGKFDEALDDYKKAIENQENPEYYFHCAVIYTLLSQDVTLSEKNHSVYLDYAFEYLQQALDKGYSDYQKILYDFDLQSLREDVRYKNIIESVNIFKNLI